MDYLRYYKIVTNNQNREYKLFTMRKSNEMIFKFQNPNPSSSITFQIYYIALTHYSHYKKILKSSFVSLHI